jgi:hypothetical protein
LATILNSENSEVILAALKERSLIEDILAAKEAIEEALNSFNNIKKD